MRKAAVIVLIEVSGLGLVFGPAVRGRRGKRGQFSGYIIIILGVLYTVFSGYILMPLWKR